MNYCFRRGYLAGPGQSIPEDPSHFNWERSGEGCSHLKCSQCGSAVTHQLERAARRYRCQCTSYDATGLEWLDEVSYKGPGDCITIEMPPWSCAGHPLAVDFCEIGSVFESPNLFVALDRAYNYARGTPGAELLAQELGRRLQAPRLKIALKRDACRFYRFNPEASGWQALLRLVDRPPKDPELLKNLCLALSVRADRAGLRALALNPISTAQAVEVMEFDREWLLENAAAIHQANARAGPALFQRTAGQGYGWDRRALLELPLEIIRPQAAFMPRRSLGMEDLKSYWERDFEWLSQNYGQICRQASDFFFYSQEFFRARGWRPDAAALEVWREQAGTNEHCYNSIPALVEFDREWLVKNLVEVVKASGVRGIWVMDLLHRAGVDIRPLIEAVRALDRYPDNWEENFSYWFKGS